MVTTHLEEGVILLRDAVSLQWAGNYWGLGEFMQHCAPNGIWGLAESCASNKRGLAREPL